MKESICGFLCECNPLHAGHEKLIDVIHQEFSHVVAALSGPFVQRGSMAMTDKWIRAAQLVAHGVDLVVEIPQTAVLQSADYYALGGVETLALIPGVTALAFGVERGAQLPDLSESRLADDIKNAMKEGKSYRVAVSQALGVELAPNQILAMQYQKALRTLSLDWEVLIVPRDPVSAHSPSATALRQSLYALYEHTETEEERREILQNDPSFQGLSDPLLYRSMRSPHLPKLDSYLSGSLLLNPPSFSSSPHFEEGMEIRFLRAFQKSGSIEGAIAMAANKRQSRARYRRFLMTTLLGICREDFRSPEYLRPLAFNEKGARILRDVSVPIVQKRPGYDLAESSLRMLSIDQKAQRLYEWLNDLPNQDLSQVYFYPSPPRS